MNISIFYFWIFRWKNCRILWSNCKCDLLIFSDKLANMGVVESELVWWPDSSVAILPFICGCMCIVTCRAGFTVLGALGELFFIFYEASFYLVISILNKTIKNWKSISVFILEFQQIIKKILKIFKNKI